MNAHDLALIAISVAGTLGAEVILYCAFILQQDHQSERQMKERQDYKARSRAYYARLRGAWPA